jgi:hypothetical protein
MGRRLLARSAGAVLVVVGIAGVWIALRNEQVACLYHEAKYGRASGDLRRICALAERAHAISPNHHLFWTWVAERCRDERKTTTGPSRAEWRGALARWCGRGLAANPWSPALRVIHAGLLSEQDPRAAVRWWESCVDWHYWEPYNHALLGELYARAGDFSRAFQVLGRIRGRRYAEEGAAIVEAIMLTEAARQQPGRAGAPAGR